MPVLKKQTENNLGGNTTKKFCNTNVRKWYSSLGAYIPGRAPVGGTLFCELGILGRLIIKQSTV